ncbi:MAG TPA: GGDEF domain-containing protein [Solirubrobacteraceae bacterium]|nr:GGDEF domain-containing protein [Solirubrobacteraceae bacterium]
MPAPALAAFALTAALACAAAAVAARLLGAGPLVSGLFVGGIALGYGACGLAVAHDARRRADREADELDELTRLLVGSTSEAQARRLLLRYVHAIAPRAGAVLLSAGEPAQGLELTFGERVLDTPLRGLASARITSTGCRALELGRAREVRRPIHGDGSEANIECALCGELAGEVTCEPLRGPGADVGALLVSGPRISSTARALIREAVRRAAPVLVVRREQAAVERRAGSDPLTALPNRPAAEQTLRRLCAQAGRAISPLAAVLLGLDRPPREKAEREQAVALVARELTAAARASDFIARYDAHTFLVLAPDTDREGGLELAEKLRRGLELLTREADGRLTASLGVAALPMDALAAEDLLRQADRALQVARALGGNRVQAAESTLAP